MRREFEHHNALAAGQLGAVETTDFNAELVAVADNQLRARLLELSSRLTDGRAANQRQIPVDVSRREVDVLTQLAAGFTNAEIAERLAILPTTVKTHLANAMRKLGTRNRVETVAAARVAGLLP